MRENHLLLSLEKCLSQTELKCNTDDCPVTSREFIMLYCTVSFTAPFVMHFPTDIFSCFLYSPCLYVLNSFSIFSLSTNNQLKEIHFGKVQQNIIWAVLLISTCIIYKFIHSMGFEPMTLALLALLLFCPFSFKFA